MVVKHATRINNIVIIAAETFLFNILLQYSYTRRLDFDLDSFPRRYICRTPIRVHTHSPCSRRPPFFGATKRKSAGAREIFNEIMLYTPVLLTVFTKNTPLSEKHKTKIAFIRFIFNSNRPTLYRYIVRLIAVRLIYQRLYNMPVLTSR